MEKAGLEFEDALATDDASDPNALPYVNVFAVRAEDRDTDPRLLKLVEIYQDTQPCSTACRTSPAAPPSG